MKAKRRSGPGDTSGQGFFGYLRSWDKYGHPVTLKYDGLDTFQTLPGACLTLLGAILVLIFFVFKGKDLILGENWAHSVV